MYYEINISKKTGKKYPEYVHFFATSDRSLGDLKTAKEAYKLLKKGFPEPDFKITISSWETTGICYNENSFLEL